MHNIPICCKILYKVYYTIILHKFQVFYLFFSFPPLKEIPLALNELFESDKYDNVEAKHLFYCQCFLPASDGPKVIPTGPEKVKLKSMP